MDTLRSLGPWTGEALWEDADRHAFFGFWIFFCEAVADDVESGLRLLQADFGTQARVEGKVAEASIGRHALFVRAIHLLHAKRQVTLDVHKGAHAVKLPWRDANDGDGATVIEDGFADDAGIATEARLPEGIAENDNGIQSDEAFRRQNEAAKKGLNAEGGKEVAADVVDDDGFGFSVQREATNVEAHGDHIRKNRRGLLLKILEFRIRKTGLQFALLELHGEYGNLFRILHGQRAEKE
jgi:hypothetical protein